MSDYNGVIKDLIAGKWVNPEDKKKYGIPIKKIEIDKSLDGKESLLISQLHPCLLYTSPSPRDPE